ncbi:hypothetical protein NPIL_459381 [Nephila pilipes]|uniref:Uncharacterized protein n=1 Tax=Nephila pilipes TaxID=299642 RepID=A0A8X6NCC0_NEPPI|nr:hypothetical protein NPIL_459381 [Nephila pilipes]
MGAVQDFQGDKDIHRIVWPSLSHYMEYNLKVKSFHQTQYTFRQQGYPHPFSERGMGKFASAVHCFNVFKLLSGFVTQGGFITY